MKKKISNRYENWHSSRVESEEFKSDKKNRFDRLVFMLEIFRE